MSGRPSTSFSMQRPSSRPSLMMRIMPSIHEMNIRDTFDQELQQINDDSCWFYGLLMLLNIPSLCNMLFYTVFFKQDMTVRCPIPDLEKIWDFHDILRVSQPRTGTVSDACSYYDYNYQFLANRSYEEVVEYLRGKPKPPIKTCSDAVTSRNHLTFYKQFNLYCKPFYIDYVLAISPHVGQIIGGIFFTFLGDLFGRRRLLTWGIDMYIIIVILLPLSTCFEAIVVCRMLSGLAFQLIETAIQAIIFEVSSPKYWGYRFMLMYSGASLGFLIGHACTKVAVNWRYLQWAISSSFLFLPILAWYFPESPVWLIERNERDKAFAVLRSIKNPIKHSHLLLMFRNEPATHYNDFKELVWYFREYAKIHLWFFVLIMAPISCIHFKSWLLNMDLQSKWKVKNFLYGIGSGIADVPAIMLSESVLYILNRKKSLLFNYSVCCIVYILASFYNEYSWEQLVLLLIADIESGVLILVGTLYACENTPISQRCTAIGWTLAFGRNLPYIIMTTLSYIFTSKQMLLIAASISLTGAAFLVLAYLIVKDFRVDFFKRPHIQ